MDKIVFYVNNQNDGGYNSRIIIMVDENKDIAKLIAKEERYPRYSWRYEGLIGFENICEVNPLLRMLLFDDTDLLLTLRVVGTNQYYIWAYLSILETQKTIIWKNTQHPRKEKSPFIISFPIDGDLPKKIPEFLFEFDKEQYFLAITHFISDLDDRCYADDCVLAARNIMEAKMTNSKRLKIALAEERRYLLDKLLSEEICCLFDKLLLPEEQYYLLEDNLLPKDKNDRKHLKMNQLSYNTNIFQ